MRGLRRIGVAVRAWGLIGTAAASLLFGSMLHGQTSARADSQASPRSVRAQLVGSWRLASRTSRQANGELLPDAGLAATPMGVLVYDATGHVAVQLSRRDRTVGILGEECQAATQIKETPGTAQTVIGYDAYFGTYTVNERDGIVTHHLEAALFPGDIGKDIERSFKLTGDTLTLSFNTTTKEGVKVTRTLVWERMK
jgi:hypothetical protein